ncbi:stage V sporulation protein AD [Thermincola ferriacetica]|uniref:Stage V sporulation protein AD n=1 Tax=Thermincola ferriacetica TaxID=281456 RepID=A0A0L6W5P1_9FIRM|nr:stage V sporulation protein AD [Thermincola ferriacetica]KNZ70786.1 stage V sporulation protein AD [Thermincola ferriacetica]
MVETTVVNRAVKKLGKQTFQLANPPVIVGAAAIVGPKEGQGPLGNIFDLVLPDTLAGEKTWEKAERKMLKDAVNMALQKANLTTKDIDFFMAGDLLNQIISANFTARDLGIPFIGLYGACSTMVESLCLGSMLIDGGFANNVAVAASSHYDTAERQYRFPTELGVQRPPSAQWTVTGAGAMVVSGTGIGPAVTHVTIGKVIDLGIKDANDMGSAMAPAAADTIVAHFKETTRQPSDYDLIISGDLASIGHSLTIQLVKQAGYDMSKNFTDCGILIFDPSQDTHAGGSGCGCSAVVLSSYILGQMKAGKYKRVLAIGTGALLSPTATLQGESIPGVAHAVVMDAYSLSGG